MNTLKTLRLCSGQALVLSAFLAIFAIFPAVAQDNTPTLAQLEKVLTKICGDSITSECLEVFLKKKDEDTHVTLFDYKLARKILGRDLITPDEVTQARGQSYSSAQLATFQSTLPSREILEWLKANDYMLVAQASNQAFTLGRT